jgi:tripartite-type tricarboxylate transporter receptor subunit TctC
VPGLYTSVWHGMWFPKATPKEAIAKLNAAIFECLLNERSSFRTCTARRSGIHFFVHGFDHCG